MKNKIITISREFGSGGRSIGKAIAEKLNIPCYDSEIISKISQESGFTKDYVKKIQDSNPSSFFSMLLNTSPYGQSNEDIIWQIQCKVIKELANKGSCVIVGRCADYILKDEQDLFKIFIYANLKFRQDRILNIYGEREDSIEKRIKDKDKNRAAYYRFHTNMKWGYAENYHISLDSSKFGIEKSIDILYHVFKGKS